MLIVFLSLAFHFSIRDGWLNSPLRFPNEPCRHKVLDLIGDFSLLAQKGNGGLPIAHILAYKVSCTRSGKCIGSVIPVLVNYFLLFLGSFIIGLFLDLIHIKLRSVQVLCNFCSIWLQFLWGCIDVF